ncbi:hypothetical protein QZH41_020208 [Actinostola sp. cb2023]|nr:hypothetical protein QZH41_020208 [Actinostola sp. cb2023]
MSVFLRNLQKRVVFDATTLIRDTSHLMQLLSVEKFDVSVVCTGGKLIKSLNLKYRKRNIQTDILAFPYFENWKPGLIPKPSLPCEYNLGDVILGMHVIEKDCEEANKNIQEYLPVVIAHGLCHLLGYSHETKDRLIQMNQKESEILKGLNKLTGYNTVPLTPSIEHNNMPDGDIERFLEYQHQPPVPGGSSNARYDKILGKYLKESQRKKDSLLQ